MGAPKKSNTGLIVGLGAVAVLLIAGAGIAAVASGKKKPTPVTTDLTGATSASAAPDTSASSSAAEDTSAAPTVATPLTPGSTPAQTNTGGATTKPSAGHAASIPTPKPPQAQSTPECQRLRRAREGGEGNARIIDRLVENCRKSGGDPDKERPGR